MKEVFFPNVLNEHQSPTGYLPVILSGRPPTNTVLHPTGLSLVDGGGELGEGGNNTQFTVVNICFPC